MKAAACRNERGFTLIEVVVAFAIFSLTAAALYEAFAQSVRSSLRATEEETAQLYAQSLLSELRGRAGPWPAVQDGVSRTGNQWRIDVTPYGQEVDQLGGWRAFEVSIHVRPTRLAASEIELQSIELARVAP
jgi:type II secretion system protein I